MKFYKMYFHEEKLGSKTLEYKESNKDNALLITIGSDGKADCGIKTVSEVNDLIHS